MNNRINQHLFAQATVATKLCHRPTLSLTADRPISVDMERFFDFSFAFAEALVDLEDKYQPQKPVVTLQRELSLKDSLMEKPECDIDARWM